MKANSETAIGGLHDISRGGLSFSYVDFDMGSFSPGKPCELMLLDSDSKVLMDGITARVVYDRGTGNGSSYSAFSMKKIGAKFIELQVDRGHGIELLLDNARS
jgi:hypothetical protein